MTITTTASSVEATGTGSQTVFSYAFLIPAQTDATLYLFDTTTGLTVTVDPAAWSMTGAGNPAGGTFTYPLVGSAIPTTKRLILRREVDATQPYVFNNQGAYYPSQVGAALDHLTLVVQQQQSGVVVEDAGTEVGLFTTINVVSGATIEDMGGGRVDLTIAGGGGGGGSGIAVKDEGSSLGTGFTILNFAGAGVAATDAGGGQATVTISGGGSGASAGRPDVPPAASGFAWVNQGGASVTDNSYGVTMLAPYATSDNVRALVKTAPSAPYRLRARIRPTAIEAALGYQHAGICWRESGTGKLLLFGQQWRSTPGAMVLISHYYTSPTTFSSSPSSVAQSQPIQWLSLRDDGTFLYFDYSSDGNTWSNFIAITRALYFTPNQIGLFVNPLITSAATYDTQLTCFSFDTGA